MTATERRQFIEPLVHAGWQESGSWPQFGHDPLHTGRADVDFSSTDLDLVWAFRPTDQVRSYRKGFSVWSSPVAGTVGSRSLVIVGCQDRVVYAVDAEQGETAWEFRPGGAVFASPVLARVGGRPMVFIASTNRSIYGLDAGSGEEVWQYETQPWSFTAAQATMSSPTVVNDGTDTLLVVGAWNSDRSAAGNVQQGEVITLSAASGQVRWRKRLGSVAVTSPAVARWRDQFVIFVGSIHGAVYCLRLEDGETLWEAVLNEQAWSSPSLAPIDGAGRVLVGSRLNSIFALDWRNGHRRWRADTGYWIDATPSWFRVADQEKDQPQAMVIAGSYDRSFYAWSPDRRSPTWSVTTGNFAYSSSAVARAADRPIVFSMSWDQHLYLIDGRSGEVLWTAECGELVWKHAWMGDSLWASPIVAMTAGQPTVFFPAYDGVLYAYRPVTPKSGATR